MARGEGGEIGAGPIRKGSFSRYQVVVLDWNSPKQLFEEEGRVIDAESRGVRDTEFHDVCGK